MLMWVEEGTVEVKVEEALNSSITVDRNRSDREKSGGRMGSEVFAPCNVAAVSVLMRFPIIGCIR